MSLKKITEKVLKDQINIEKKEQLNLPKGAAILIYISIAFTVGMGMGVGIFISDFIHNRIICP